MDPKAMFKLTYGLFVLTANYAGRDNGCIINTAAQVTSTPNRISIAVNKSNLTHDLIKKSLLFTVSVIAEDAKFDLITRFGFASGRDTEKFAGLDAKKRLENCTYAVTAGTNAYLTGRVVDMIDLGTHTLFIADVTDGEILSDVPSATYAYYQTKIKPKPAAPAAKPEEGKKKVWRCTVCGYEYEGEELPADFTCPICKHPASDFE